MLSLRQAITFCILMANNKGILTKNPSYLFEKLKTCSGHSVPEVILDSENYEIFKQYAEKFDFNWNKSDAWELPINQFDSVTGEPKRDKK